MKQAHRDATLDICRAALRTGHLTKDRKHWTFGRRRFRPRTVNALIDAGEAIRIGPHVVRWRMP